MSKHGTRAAIAASARRGTASGIMLTAVLLHLASERLRATAERMAYAELARTVERIDPQRIEELITHVAEHRGLDEDTLRRVVGSILARGRADEAEADR